METILVVFNLAVKSSYSRNLEVNASAEEFDTVQFFYNGDDLLENQDLRDGPGCSRLEYRKG